MACPGCGMQRAVVQVFSGNFTAAFNLFPAVFTIFGLAIFLIFNLFYKFKYDYTVKIALIIINAVIIAGAYLIKSFQHL